MNRTNIIALPHADLRKRSQKVGIITEGILSVVEDMKNATIDWDQSRDHEVGVALAAVQIDQLLRIIIVRNNFDNKNDHGFMVFINPEITKYEGSVEEDFEGCLSVRDIYGKIPRYSKVRVKATDVDGREFRITAEGFLARVFQHEIDHLNGKLFIDHIYSKKDAFYRLQNDGDLEQLDYEKDIKDSNILWK